MVLSFELLKALRQWEIIPDIVSYSAAISACEKGAEWLLLSEILKKLRQWCLQPDAISYSAAINA